MTGSTPTELHRPTEDEAAFHEVVRLAKGARQTVGFLPDSAFRQRARQGTLLVCAAGSSLGGYVLYDLPRDQIRIVQLVVAPSFRGKGVARTLVDAVADAHPDRRGILLHCRNDFPAHGMWPKLDFIPMGERPGRSFDGKLLTRWFRSFGQPDLFTAVSEADTRPIATMDSCVFFDLVALRPKPVAGQLRADWLGEHVRLAITDHVMVELHDGRDAAERKRQRIAAEAFRLPPLAGQPWKAIEGEILERHPDASPKDRRDIVHAAKAIAAQATWLITSDRRFKRIYSATLADLGGLRLIFPAEFVREIDEQARGDRYRPVDLAGTSVTSREVDSDAVSGLAAIFVSHGQGERIGQLRRAIDLAAVRPTTVHLELIEVDGEARGLICWELRDGELRALLLRVASGRGETTLGRHMLSMLRDQATASEVEVIRLLDPAPSVSVQRNYTDEGFARSEGGVVTAYALSGAGSTDQLEERMQALGAQIDEDDGSVDARRDPVARAAAAERWLAPYRVIGSGIPTFVVPIRPAWAKALFNVGLAQDELFAREWSLGLRRELVYYRSPLNGRGIRAPARILWYVSRMEQSEPGAIRAASHLIEVTTAPADRLFYRFQALGVYRRDQVEGCSDSRGDAMALRFSHTELFKHPVRQGDYEQIMKDSPDPRRIVLLSPQQVSEHVFASILERGSARDV